MSYPETEMQSIRWLAFRNDASETVPAFAVLRVTGAATHATTGETAVTCAKPSLIPSRVFAINGPHNVAPGSFGVCTMDAGPVYALYGSGTPGVGQQWGPVAGQWSLASGKPGFLIVGSAISDGAGQRALVLPTTAAGKPPVRFELMENRNYSAHKSRAKVVVWNGSEYLPADPAVEITVVGPITKFTGKTGYRGWAIKMADRDQESGGGTYSPDIYEIVYMEGAARWLEFTLTADAEAVEDEAAQYKAEVKTSVSEDEKYYYFGAAPNHKPPSLTEGESESEEDALFVWDNFGILKNGEEGDMGRAFYDETLDRYYVTEIQTKASLIHFTLSADLTSSSASATVTSYYSNNGWDKIDPGGETIDVYDPQGKFNRAQNGAKGVARYDFREDRYIIILCEQKAAYIKFALTADMASSSATASVSSYWGSNGWDIQNPGSSVTVYDELARFARALTGAVGVAAYNWKDDKYHIVNCQEKAGFIEFVLTSAMSSGSGSATLVSHWGSSPWDVLEPTISTVYSSATLYGTLPSGVRGVAAYSHEDDKYYIIGLKDCVQYAEAESNWEENSGNPRVAAEVTTDGAGAHINVYLPRVAGRDPNVRAGDVIGFMFDASNSAVCVTDYLDDKIGTIKLWNSDSGIPPGWSLCDGSNGTVDLSGRFVVGFKTGDSDFGGVGSGGGTKKHNQHYTACPYSIDNTGPTTIYSWLGASQNVGTTDGAGDVNHLPPFYALAYIQRVD